VRSISRSKSPVIFPPFRTMNLAISRSALRRFDAARASTTREKKPGLFPVRLGWVAGAENDVRVRTKERADHRRSPQTRVSDVPGRYPPASVHSKMGPFVAVRKTGQHR
jgi:hypothetical protein